MRSMTGFGSSEYVSDKLRVTVDLKAYNNKFLDISLNMPPWLSQVEGKIRDLVKVNGIQRGRVDLNIRVKELEEDVQVIIDENMAEEVLKGLEAVKKRAGIAGDIALSDIMSFDGVLKTEKKRDVEALWKIVESEVEKVLEEFINDKIGEGDSLREDIFLGLKNISSLVDRIESYTPQVEEKIKNNFKEKFREILGDEIEESRILSELAVLLVKYDINEEVVRLRSHIDNFKKSSNIVPCGKKLDFICQEMNREINTIGSKSPMIEISEIVVDMKNSLEQIREQARNVE